MSEASRELPPPRALPINADALRRDAAQLFAAAERLDRYRSFLASARAAKASSRSTKLSSGSVAVDRQVRAAARTAVGDVAEACSASARIIQVLQGTGALQQIGTGAAEVLKASGPVRVGDLWRTRLASANAKKMIRDVGASDGLMDTLGRVVERLDVHVTVEGTKLRSHGTIEGRPVDGRVETAPRTARPTSVADLLSRGRWEARCRQVERGEPAYLLGHGLDGDPRPEDLLLRDLLATQREGVRHLRKLEDAGLTTYAGGDPATIAAVGIIVLVIGALVAIYYCSGDDESNGPEGGCAIGYIISALGLVILLHAGPPPGTGTTTQNSTGTPMIRGPLPQLIGRSP